MYFTDESLEELVKGWLDFTLPFERWTPHASHVATTVWHLRRYPLAEAVERMRRGIQAFNRANGRSTGYHDTLTVYYVHAIYGACQRLDRGQGVAALAEAVIDHLGVSHEMRLAGLRLHYRDPEAMLKSDEARLRFMPPDLAPLPGQE